MMETPKFRQLLLGSARPILHKYGYAFHQESRLRGDIYAFVKTMQDGNRCAILFHRQKIDERPVDYGFAIELLRGKTNDFVYWERSENDLDLRLSQVLWYVHDLHIYEGPGHIWTGTKPDQSEMQIQDALDKLTRYGIPWLEDPNSRNPWHIPQHLRSEFEAELRRHVQPEMETVGYVLRNDTDTRGLFFMKPLPNGLNAFVQFDQKYLLDPPQLQVDVHLERQATDSPYQRSDFRREESLRATLEFLIWIRTGLPMKPPRANGLDYSNSEQLVKRLTGSCFSQTIRHSLA